MKYYFLITFMAGMVLCFLQCPAQSYWGLTGNSGTNSSTNFIGTTDNVSFKIKTNNLVRFTVTNGGRVVIGTGSADGKLHVKGTTDNPQLIIDAGTVQSNTNPLIKLRNKTGGDLMWIHSDHITNAFVGFGCGSVNYGTNNTALGSASLATNSSGSFNTAVGSQALNLNSSGQSNTAIGNAALMSNISGFSNVAIGAGALSSSTTRTHLVAVGDSALLNNSTGYSNTAVGSKALFSNDNGANNTALGWNAQYYNVSGYDNTAIGTLAMRDNTAGNRNTSLGSESMLNNTANDNVAVGHASMHANSTGTKNTSIGTYAMYSTNADQCIAVGYDAMGQGSGANDNLAVGVSAFRNNPTGSNNIAIGNSSMFNSTSGYSNIAIGIKSLYSNGSGKHNVVVGDSAWKNSSGGSRNTAVGGKVMGSFGNGIDNVAIGFSALYASGGNYNVAIGSFALSRISTGFSSNTACGYSALMNLNTATRNTALGNNAGDSYENGNYCTFLGSSSDGSAAGFTNSTAIGDAATFNANNKVRIGDIGIATVEGQVAYAWPSDARFKDNIEEDVQGLDFILKLKPVSYNFNRTKFARHVGQDITPDKENNMNELSKIRTVGFLAQDVEKVIEETGFSSFDAVRKPTNETDNYSVAYAEFVVPLVKAVQELSAEVEMIRSVLTPEQNRQLEQLRGNETGVLEQNTPNPFSESTIIGYRVPNNCSSAIIKVSASDGTEMRQYHLTPGTKGKIEITGRSFPQGIYHYTLYIDGGAKQTRQFVITR